VSKTGDIKVIIATGSPEGVAKFLELQKLENKSLIKVVVNTPVKPEGFPKVNLKLKPLLVRLAALKNEGARRDVLKSLGISPRLWDESRKLALREGLITMHGCRGSAHYTLTTKGYGFVGGEK